MLRLKYIYITAGIVFIFIWVIMAMSMILNPWFSITKNALSDLGGDVNNNHPFPVLPEIYNFGLIIEGILIAFLSSLFIDISKNKIEIAGLSFFIISGLFLALIGIYHEGTYPHNFVSIWFFILSSISYITVGISLLIQKINHGIIITALIPLSWIIFIIVPWQSVAEDEIFGIIVIEILVFIYILSIKKRERKLYETIK